MQNKIFVALLLGLLTLSSTTNAWSCSVMGSDKHVGFLLDFSFSSKIFAIHDAESNSPITVHADDSILAQLTNSQGRFLVEFESEGSGLRTTEIKL